MTNKPQIEWQPGLVAHGNGHTELMAYYPVACSIHRIQLATLTRTGRKRFVYFAYMNGALLDVCRSWRAAERICESEISKR